jgi:hypothetical protein
MAALVAGADPQLGRQLVHRTLSVRYSHCIGSGEPPHSEALTPWQEWGLRGMDRWPPLRTSFAEVTVTSSTTDEYIGWNVPTDIDLARMQLEELFK